MLQIFSSLSSYFYRSNAIPPRICCTTVIKLILYAECLYYIVLRPPLFTGKVRLCVDVVVYESSVILLFLTCLWGSDQHIFLDFKEHPFVIVYVICIAAF